MDYQNKNAPNKGGDPFDLSYMGELSDDTFLDRLDLILDHHTHLNNPREEGPFKGGSVPDGTGDSTSPSSELVRAGIRREENGERQYLQTVKPDSSFGEATPRYSPYPFKRRSPN